MIFVITRVRRWIGQTLTPPTGTKHFLHADEKHCIVSPLGFLHTTFLHLLTGWSTVALVLGFALHFAARQFHNVAICDVSVEPTFKSRFILRGQQVGQNFVNRKFCFVCQ
jgi:hypothetical protein